MRHFSRLIIMVGSLLLISPSFSATYYVDAYNGNDSNNGLTAKSSWKTLSKVSNTSFRPGDIISFKSGQLFKGVLVLSSSGSSSAPISYTTYGGKQKAIIDGNGNSAAVYSYNKQYIELRNIAVTNFKEGLIKDNDLFDGICIVNHDFGTLHHFYFDNIRVFNVNSTHIPKDEGKTDQSRFHGGVLFYTTGNKLRSNFDDVMVTNSVFENLSRTGFNFRSDWANRTAYSKFGDSIGGGKTDNWTPNTKVVFRKNIFKNIAGNGLIVRVAKSALIEHNLFDSCGQVISGNAVFNFNTDDVVYQYNEARNTIYNDGDTDARGIDSDYRTKNTIIQYNYLHNNGLGGVTATGGPGGGNQMINFNLGTIIRYNVIENNARQGMYVSGKVEGLQVYNNVFYADSGLNDIIAIKLNKWIEYPNGVSFKNNIFCFKGNNPSYAFTNATNVSFDHNIYCGLKAPSGFIDRFPIMADPQFIFPGKGKQGYKLLKNSPAKRSGIPVSGNASKDFYGNKIPNASKLNIGVDNQ
ncbi:MAG: right-handed parallel beta-helix repeat-containing protein [Bacteroidota bacterium]|nr:right-handed parallel beta-helix repeat-containing protein [Bacteroidota bacterium]